MVARRRARGVLVARARLRPVPARRRSGRRGADGDVARGGPPRLQRRARRRERLAAPRAPAAGAARAGARSRLARLPRGLRGARRWRRREARERAADAADLGRRLGVADLEMLGLALEGATLVACARVEEGMRLLDEATATALEGEAQIPISSAWTCCFLVTACTAVLDFDRASTWCDRIAAFAERYGSRYMLGFCGAEYGAVHLWRGRWDEAERMLEASLRDFSRSRPALGPVAARGPRGAPPPPGQGVRCCAAPRRGRPHRRGAARAAPASRSTRGDPLAPRSSPSGCCAGPPTSASSIACPRSSCSSARGRRSATSSRQAPPSASCAPSSASSAQRRCARCVDRAEGGSPQPPVRSRPRAGAARGRRRPLRGERRAVRGRGGAHRARRLARRPRPPRRSQARGRRGECDARAAGGEDGGRARARGCWPAATARRASPRASARCCACSPRAPRTARSRSGSS